MPITTRNWKPGGLPHYGATFAHVPFLAGNNLLQEAGTDDFIAGAAINTTGSGGGAPVPGDVFVLQGASPFVNGAGTATDPRRIELPAPCAATVLVSSTSARLILQFTGENQFGERKVEALTVGDGTNLLFATANCWSRITEIKYLSATDQTGSMVIGAGDLQQNLPGGAGVRFPKPARGASVRAAWFTLQQPDSGTSKVVGRPYQLTITSDQEDSFCATGLDDNGGVIGDGDAQPYTIVDLYMLLDKGSVD